MTRQNIAIGQRVKLLGIVFSVRMQDVTGNVLIENGPTQIQATGDINVPTNLGGCIKASEIMDFERVLLNGGFTPPEDYLPSKN